MWIVQGRTFAKYSSTFLKQHVDGFRLVAIHEEALENEFGMEHKAVRMKFLEMLQYQLQKDSTR